MKRIRKLDGPTPGLADYQNRAGGNGCWQDFRSPQGVDAYRELVAALWTLQHGLCGYCEIDIPSCRGDSDRQIEHVIPRSDPNRGRDHELDPANLMLCCKGGTYQTNDNARRLPPLSKNLSCGQAKADCVDPEFLDPRDLPALPALMRDGTMAGWGSWRRADRGGAGALRGVAGSCVQPPMTV